MRQLLLVERHSFHSICNTAQYPCNLSAALPKMESAGLRKAKIGMYHIHRRNDGSHNCGLYDLDISTTTKSNVLVFLCRRSHICIDSSFLFVSMVAANGGIKVIPFFFPVGDTCDRPGACYFQRLQPVGGLNRNPPNESPPGHSGSTPPFLSRIRQFTPQVTRPDLLNSLVTVPR